MSNDLIKSRRRIMSMTYTSMFAVLISVCSWICVPMAVPFTMQTFAIFCTMLILGGKKGTCSVILYIALGCMGLPVFSGFQSGIGTLLGMTGGYIVGFIFLAITYLLFTKFLGESLAVKLTALILGLAICYAFGTVWFMKVYASKMNQSISLFVTLSKCVFPFIIPDLAKLGFALTISKCVGKYVRF